jgi:NTP pyrophosphatase (non-canonical NTP hydrolase)
MEFARIGKLAIEYRNFVMDSRWYKHAGERNSPEMNYIVLGIAGEAGETADAWKKLVREHGIARGWEDAPTSNKMKVYMEAGDVLWYIMDLCIFAGIDLHELMLLNTVKLFERLRERQTQHGLGVVPWPLSDLSYEDALKLTLRTEAQIIGIGAAA